MTYQETLEKCIAAGIGCSIAGFITNPMDVVKIRNQQFGGELYGRFFTTFGIIYRQETFKGLLKGAQASVLREATYSSFRLGMYEPIKKMVKTTTNVQSDNNVIVKWGSAFISGALGSALFNPIDLIKVRFQSHLPNTPAPYNNSLLLSIREISQTEGFSGLYKGCSATVIRAALVTCGQLGSYDVIKNNLLVSYLRFDKDSLKTHFIASLLASLVAVTICNPPDVVKTRLMNCKDRLSGFRVVADIFKNEGVRGFMKGWTASYCRIGPHTVISFVLTEYIRKVIGMNTY